MSMQRLLLILLVSACLEGGLAAKLASQNRSAAANEKVSGHGGLRLRRHLKHATKLKEVPKSVKQDKPEAPSIDSLASNLADKEKSQILQAAESSTVAKSHAGHLKSKPVALPARAEPVPPPAPRPPAQNATGELDASGEPRYIFGFRKIVWALLADAVAMAIFISCVPFILTLVKRRRPQPQAT
mmetsp:Transcript_89879/g.159918  ORF Transcript_89879/g.159918 Transcript_89879/m.159918 type:complete len:185 (+) Transcript_89879:82-636(+)